MGSSVETISVGLSVETVGKFVGVEEGLLVVGKPDGLSVKTVGKFVGIEEGLLVLGTGGREGASTGDGVTTLLAGVGTVVGGQR